VTSPLAAALYAVYLEHRRCGDLGAGVEDERVWMTCGGAEIVRALEPPRCLCG
jgi:hypothetical protein